MKNAAREEKQPATLNELLDQTTARVPNRTALVTPSETWTFAELRRKVLQAAAAFHGRGIRKGDCVAIVLRNSPEFIVAYFGLARLGAFAVPLNFLVQKPEELRYMLNDCSAVGVVTQKDFLRGLLQARKNLPKLRSVWAVDAEDAATEVEHFGKFIDQSSSESLPEISISEQDVAAIIYTSGTTGSPKGVMLSHGNLVSNCRSSVQAMGVTEKDVPITILPMFHTFAWTGCVLVSLFGGATNVIIPSITPATPWLKLMGKHGVTLFPAIPPVFAVLAKEARGFKKFLLRWWFFRKVRFCVSGAAPLNPDAARAFESALGAQILEGYGLTETSPVATINRLGARRLGSVGPPIDEVKVKIIRDDESPAPLGEEGEICIQGPNVMLGYLHLPEATREAFTRDGWLKTGDVGILDKDGCLFIRDRKKDMIIIKGLKVFSAQIEQVIAAHPDVEEAAVVGIPYEHGDEIIKAFIVLKPGATADKSSLLQYCRQKLDAYKRPRDIEIVESLPKNALQKVLKRVLRQQELDKRKSAAAG